MLELSKKILSKVSFDKHLFRNELNKSIRWIKKTEIIHLKVWTLATFTQHKDIILDVFDSIS